MCSLSKFYLVKCQCSHFRTRRRLLWRAAQADVGELSSAETRGALAVIRLACSTAFGSYVTVSYLYLHLQDTCIMFMG